VRFRGNVDRGSVVRFLRDADLFCFPTASEGFPKVVIEALACGLPVLTTRVSVLPYLLSRGAGVLLDELSPEALAAGVRRCSRGAESCAPMSACALEPGRQFSLEKWQEALATSLPARWGPLRSSSPRTAGAASAAVPPAASMPLRKGSAG